MDHLHWAQEIDIVSQLRQLEEKGQVSSLHARYLNKYCLPNRYLDDKSFEYKVLWVVHEDNCY